MLNDAHDDLGDEREDKLLRALAELQGRARDAVYGGPLGSIVTTARDRRAVDWAEEAIVILAPDEPRLCVGCGQAETEFQRALCPQCRAALEARF